MGGTIIEVIAMTCHPGLMGLLVMPAPLFYRLHYQQADVVEIPAGLDDSRGVLQGHVRHGQQG